MFNKLYSAFKKLTDNRVQGRTKYAGRHHDDRPHGAIRDRAGWTAISAFAADNVAALQQVLTTLSGAPSSDTIARVVAGANQLEIHQVVVKVGEDLSRRHPRGRPGRRRASDRPDVVAIDGKTIRGAVAPGEKSS
jgi:hypothetical protein